MEQDKKLHLIAGFAVAVVVGWLMTPMTGFMAGLIAGLGKEGYDLVVNYLAKRRGEKPPHSADIEDFLYTAIGGALGTMVLGVVLYWSK